MDIHEAHRDLSAAEFLGFIESNTPVVVRDAIPKQTTELWTPDEFADIFGDEKVQVFDDGFHTLGVMKFGDYIEEMFQRTPDGNTASPLPYVRWYSRYKDADFPWADNILEELSEAWTVPAFVPTDNLLLPPTREGQPRSPATSTYPARGLFVSPAGARTRLHVDPWASEAILCQFHGSKAWRMYPPSQAPFLTNGDKTFDPDAPDAALFPKAPELPCMRFDLHPGDLVLVPQGWFHHVTTTSDSIALTWNLVHRCTAESFLRYLKSESAGADHEVLSFFFDMVVEPNGPASNIADAIGAKRI